MGTALAIRGQLRIFFEALFLKVFSCAGLLPKRNGVAGVLRGFVEGNKQLEIPSSCVRCLWEVVPVSMVGKVLEFTGKLELSALGQMAHNVAGVSRGKVVDRRFTAAVLVSLALGYEKTRERSVRLGRGGAA